MAEQVNVSSDTAVAQSVDRLVHAVKATGAKIFTKVDFSQGAGTAGETERPTSVVIFERPKIGSSTLQDARTLALYLPLRILFFEDVSGQSWAMYHAPISVAPSHRVTADNPAILRMQGALEKFAAIATGN